MLDTIAVDGPAASGKNTIGMLLAQQLRYAFIDTGGMYRALTWLALQEAVPFNDEPALASFATKTPLQVRPAAPDSPESHMFVDGQDLTPYLHLPEVDATVSLLARIAPIRERMVAMQRALAVAGRVVMAGRDIGTVVLPDAALKVYLDASAEERARRRYHELALSGAAISYEEVLRDVLSRDAIDSGRANSPLRPADDAQIINTDGRSPDDLVADILARWEAVRGAVQ